jgi:hypothetical protein
MGEDEIAAKQTKPQSQLKEVDSKTNCDQLASGYSQLILQKETCIIFLAMQDSV